MRERLDIQELRASLAGRTERQAASAGGLLGGAGGDSFSGQREATGDLRFTFNDVPSGWLECDGTTLLQSEYRNLFRVLGTRFNLASTPQDSFRLPGTSDIVPLSVLGRWIIRW